MGRITTRRPVRRMTSKAQRRHVDTLAVEEPLDVRMDGSPFVITKRTPDHDVDLVHGLLCAEGVIAEAADVTGARYPLGADGAPLYDVLDVRLAGTATPAVVAARHFLTSSACGICGTESLERLQRQSRYRPARPHRSAPTISSRGPKGFARRSGPSPRRAGSTLRA
jgi:FdhD protein